MKIKRVAGVTTYDGCSEVDDVVKVVLLRLGVSLSRVKVEGDFFTMTREPAVKITIDKTSELLVGASKEGINTFNKERAEVYIKYLFDVISKFLVSITKDDFEEFEVEL